MTVVADPNGQTGPSAIQEELILVLDFGGQTAQLIARRIRDQSVFCQLVRHDLSIERIQQLKPKGIILSGGPASVYEPNAPKVDPRLFELVSLFSASATVCS